MRAITWLWALWLQAFRSGTFWVRLTALMFLAFAVVDVRDSNDAWGELATVMLGVIVGLSLRDLLPRGKRGDGGADTAEQHAPLKPSV